ncbi:MAG: precorrin-3B C(17)-methyltransferase [Candidatus Hydrogenedentota bacterium]
MVGIGPGDIALLTQQALAALGDCEVVIGYKTYTRLIGNLVNDKKVISLDMHDEIKRAKLAIKKASQGKDVCVISGGDAGIYGMAGLILELLNKEEKDRIKIEFIPGIPAVSACASLLGAPLMHDFVVISLSDLLTDKELIEKRVRLGCQADFIIVFYNPKSKKRRLLFERIWQILMKYKSSHTPVGIVQNAYRDNEKVEITNLKDMLNSKIIDMSTTIIVGNTKTYVKGKFMITPRGYNLARGKNRRSFTR